METLSPSVVLAAYAESLVDGRRVAVFGDATSTTAEELLERGARLVHLYDPDPARAAEAAARNRSKQISVLPLDTADIAVRDGAFDVAIIPDLASIEDGARLLKRIRRALSPRGLAIIASPNPDAKVSLLPRVAAATGASIGYYDLFDAVSAEFAEVRMLGQTPFVGYAVVDFSPEGEPDVSLDSGLVPGGAEEPEWFVVVASASPVEIEAFSIVQLPTARVVRGNASGSGDPRIAGELRAARANEARLVEHLSTLQAEIAERRAAGVTPQPDSSTDRTRALETELSKRETQLAEVETRAAAADARARGVEVEIQSLREKQKSPTALDAARADFEKRAAEYRSEQERLEKHLALYREEKERIEKRLAEQEGEKQSLQKHLAQYRGDKERLEKRLSEQAAEKARFEERLTEQRAEKDRLEKGAAEYRVEKERLEKRLAEHGTEQGRLDHLEKVAAEHLAARAVLEKTLGARDVELQRLTAVSAGDAPDDIAVLEAALKDRGEALRKVEADLREAERVGKELVRELAARTPKRSGAREPVPAESRILSSENARLKADLEAAGWTIQELEGRLAPAPTHAAALLPR